MVKVAGHSLVAKDGLDSPVLYGCITYPLVASKTPHESSHQKVTAERSPRGLVGVPLSSSGSQPRPQSGDHVSKTTAGYRRPEVLRGAWSGAALLLL